MTRQREQVRRTNLERLVEEAGSAAALARLAGTSESYLSQLRNHTVTPKGTRRGIGDGLAAKLERAMGKASGWLDTPWEFGPAQEAELEEGPAPKGMYPLISWVQAGDWTEVPLDGSLVDAEHFPCPVRCSKDTFVLRVRGHSMEPAFHKGELIFVDPNESPDNGRYVVVSTQSSGEATFKQLVVEGSDQYLLASNPDWPKRIIEIDEEARICGVVVFAGRTI